MIGCLLNISRGVNKKSLFFNIEKSTLMPKLPDYHKALSEKVSINRLINLKRKCHFPLENDNLKS